MGLPNHVGIHCSKLLKGSRAIKLLQEEERLYNLAVSVDIY